jgi:hypothetical protein
MTPEVLRLRFSNAIANGFSPRDSIKGKKVSRKWLAFNEFYSGGRIR